MGTHAAVGRRLGISDSDIEQLIELRPEHFKRREWLALKYAQEWIFRGGQEPEAGWVAEFRDAYTALEQDCILKLLRMMRFANQFNNTFFRKKWRPELESGAPSCRIP